MSELIFCKILLALTVTLNKEASVNNYIINSQAHKAVIDEVSCSCHDEIQVKYMLMMTEKL